MYPWLRTATLLSLVAIPAAQSHEPNRAACDRLDAVELHDYNEDGHVDREELDGVRDYLFKEADSDKDGRLNRAEYAALLMALVSETVSKEFKALDKSRDKAISPEEYSAAIADLIDVTD